jgi:hypothetical protein
MAASASLFARLSATAFIAAGVIATPALADENLGAVGGLTYMRDSTAMGAAPAEAEVTADCLPGTRLNGGGVTPPSSPFSESWVNTSLPVDGADAGSAPDGRSGRIANLAGGAKSIAAYAICTAGSVRSRSARTRIDASDSGSVKAKCPAGTRVASGGAGLDGAASKSYLNSSYPLDGRDGDSKPDDGWKARAFNASSSRAHLRVSVQCVAMPLAYRSFEANTGGLRFAPCPAGHHALAGGIKADGEPGVGHINAAYPYAEPTNPPDAGFVLAMGSTFGSGPSYTAHVICARP